MFSYDALFTPDTEIGIIVITFPDVPEANSQARTLEEAYEMAQDALATAMEFYVEGKKDLPKARTHRGRHLRRITLPSLLSAKLHLYAALRAAGMRKAELARRLGIPKQQVERLFDLRHKSHLDQIEKALAILGKRLNVAVEAA